MKGTGVFWVALGLALASSRATSQTDTNRLDARKVQQFWAALQRTNAVRVFGFGDSVMQPTRGSKMAGFTPPLSAVLGVETGGVTANAPYLYYSANGIGVNSGPDTNWWWNHFYLTNGSVVTFLCAAANGPAGNYAYVWCDTVAAYYLTDPGGGTITISLSTNGGPFGMICSINTAGPHAGAATNITVPLDYYQMRIACTNGSATLIDGGMWNDHQPGLALVWSTAPGMAYTDWTDMPTNVTWPIFKAWRPDLVLMEAKDSADSFRVSIPLLEQMFTNCAPGMDAIYIGTTALGTNGQPTANEVSTIPQNNVMADFAQQFDRAYWDSFSIVSYEQASFLGWTIYDGSHFNQAGGTALGNMLWSDLWTSLHRMETTTMGAGVNLAWYALVGRSYQLEYTPTLSPAQWQSLGGPLTASSYTMWTTDLPGGAQSRFYRLLLLP